LTINLKCCLILNNLDDENHNDDEIEKTLAILIGLIAGVGLIIVFLSFLSKLCEKQRGMVLLHTFISIQFQPLLILNIYNVLFLNNVMQVVNKDSNRIEHLSLLFSGKLFVFWCSIFPFFAFNPL